jgi:hypothetical protein
MFANFFGFGFDGNISPDIVANWQTQLGASPSPL